MGDESSQALQGAVQAKFRGRAADRADERAHVGIGVLELQPVAAAKHIDRQQTGGVRDLFREIHRKVPQRSREPVGQGVRVGHRRHADLIAALKHFIEFSFMVVRNRGVHGGHPWLVVISIVLWYRNTYLASPQSWKILIWVK